MKNYFEHEECRNQEYGVIRTNDLEQISPALKSKRNPLYRKIERSSLFALLFMIPMFLAAFIAMAAYDNSFMCVVIALACVYLFFDHSCAGEKGRNIKDSAVRQKKI